MKNRRNYYRILHVQPDAPTEVIKASYRTLMQKLKLHPDLGGDEWNASVLNEAHAVLANKEKRASYDEQFLHTLRKTQHPENRKGSSGKSHENENGGKQQDKNKNTTKHAPEQQSDEEKQGKSEYWKDSSLCPFCGRARPLRSQYSSNILICSGCHGPLGRVAQLHICGKSKRRLERITHDAPIRIQADPDIELLICGVIGDLSPQGMQCTVGSQLSDDQIILISSELLSATGRVAHCTQDHMTGQFVIGVQFLTLHFIEQVGTFFSGSA